MLQFAQKQGRVKRKALLVNTTGGLDFDALKTEPSGELPQPLIGDAFDRMKADPELIAIKKRFAWSIGVVGALVLVATIFHLNRDRWFPESTKPVLQPVVHVEESGPASLLPRDTRIATAQRPDKKLDKLDFRLPDKPEPAQASPTRIAQSPTLNPAPKIGAKNPIPGVSLSSSPSGGKARSTSNSKGGNMLGTLPRSLFRIAKKRPATQVEHDLTKAKAALVGFLKAANVNQRMQFVADRTSVEPRARSYYVRTGDGPVTFEKITDAETVGNGTVSEHDVMLHDGRVWRASVVKTAEGNYLVDWPSFVAESELEWPVLMQQKSSQLVMLRVAAEAGDFFEGDFRDSKWLLCVKLSHPTQPESPPIFAYVERQSVLGREVDYWLKLGESQVMPMTVRVKYPPLAATDNQVWLSELVAPGWVLRNGQPIVQAKGTGGELVR